MSIPGDDQARRAAPARLRFLVCGRPAVNSFSLSLMAFATRLILLSSVTTNGMLTPDGKKSSPRLYIPDCSKKAPIGKSQKPHLRSNSRTNLLFSFEKMAVRDAVASDRGARAFAEGLYAFLYGTRSTEERFDAWVEIVGNLPRRRTRVLTWPVATVFGFLADPRTHFFFKPTVTREAARRLGMNLPYVSRPSWPVYKALLLFLVKLRAGLHDMRPRDMIDLQSFLWVQGSDEYPD